MKYWVEPCSKNIMYTEKLLRHLVSINGHEHTLDDDAIILMSICDVTEIARLRRLRMQYPRHTIIAGGHFAKIGAPVMSLFADMVWVGHGFDFFRHKSLDAIRDDSATYWQGKNSVTLCNYNIDWSQCPIIQVDLRRFYVFGGVGCRGKCHFCCTSWTEPHANRPGIALIHERAQRRLGSKGSVKIISNAYSKDMTHDKVQDMRLVDFNRTTKFKRAAMVRCGVEFATEEMRRKRGKPLDDAEIAAAIDLAGRHGVDLHLFFIGGVDRKEDWYAFMENFPLSDDMKPRVFLKWTNFEPQQKTPMWRQCRDIDPSRYLDKSNTDDFFRIGAHRNKRVRVLPVKYPAHALWRCMMSNVRTMGEYERVAALSNQKDIDVVYSEFLRMSLYDNDMSDIITCYDKRYAGGQADEPP